MLLLLPTVPKEEIMKIKHFLLVIVVCAQGYSQQSPADQFHAVPLASTGITGFRFPQPAATILSWVKNNNQNAIASHAWGLWAALTQWSDQDFEGQRLRVFETWNDPTDLRTPSGNAPQDALSPIAPLRTPRRFALPRQLEDALNPNLISPLGVNDQTPTENGPSVKYDPEASSWIARHSLLSNSTLKMMIVDEHRKAIPSFNSGAIVLKPMFRALSSSDLIQGRYFLLKSWPGPPPLQLSATDQMWHTMSFGEPLWTQCVWIDLMEPNKNGSGATDCKTQTDAATYGINQFIHFRLSASEAKLATDENKNRKSAAIAKSGDYAVLLAMHVTTKEIGDWTWQTFWWSDRPKNPPAPSSATIAARRPAHLDASGLHYAQCSAYEEVLTSGKGDESVYCYNPYLEAGAPPPRACPRSNQGGRTTRKNTE